MNSVSRLNSMLGVRRDGIRARLVFVEAANFFSFSAMFSIISAETSYRRLSPLIAPRCKVLEGSSILDLMWRRHGQF